MAYTPTKLDYTVVDVFTDTRYEGNPLAIVELPARTSVSQEQKQSIAREFNFSETVFLHVGGDTASTTTESVGENHYRLDIFTTTAELPFAGHPTIGSACFALGRTVRKGASTISANAIPGSFRTKAGLIRLQYDLETGQASAEIPHNIRVHAASYGANLVKRSQATVRNLPAESPIVSIVKGMTFVLVELPDLDDLGRVSLPQMADDVRLDEGWESFVGTYFFVSLGEPSGANQPVQLRARMLENQLEDPATGSAACTLASFLAMRDAAPGETMQYEITQGVEMGRKSSIGVDVAVGEDGNVQNVRLRGSSVEIMSGKLIVPEP
jgi:PhzF family phenazine biosynthesis protein